MLDPLGKSSPEKHQHTSPLAAPPTLSLPPSQPLPSTFGSPSGPTVNIVPGTPAAEFHEPSYTIPTLAQRVTTPPGSVSSQQFLSEKNLLSPTRSTRRADTFRFEDELEIARAEQLAHEATVQDQTSHKGTRLTSKTKAAQDDFDRLANRKEHGQHPGLWIPPKEPITAFGKLFLKMHHYSILTRYFFYMLPLALVLLIPLFIGAFAFYDASIGGVRMMWFFIWLEILWLTLWGAKIVSKAVPPIIGVICGTFTNSFKKWRNVAGQLELPITLLLWSLSFWVSFLPLMKHNHVDGNIATKDWETLMNRVLLSLFIAMVMNVVEKIIIQMIALNFHERQYEDRITLSKFQISSLAKMYQFSRERLKHVEDEEFELPDPDQLPSGVRTPRQNIRNVAKTVGKQAKRGLNAATDVVGKVAGEIAGRRVAMTTDALQVVLTLLSTTRGSQTLARRIYKSFCTDGETVSTDEGDEEVVKMDTLADAFDNQEEAEAAFQMFDKDMNGDVTCEEIEMACVEVGRERKAITTSLKDLDNAVSKLDDIFTFIVAVIALIVFVSLISRSVSGILTTAGSTLLALSWLFSGTAQEILASLVFIFVKHPFDVGDRVDVPVNGSVTSLIVKEIRLMATEFRMLDGRIVQAPNSILNTVFILNMRRTGGVAEGAPVILKFGTTLEQIDALRQAMLEFVRSEKRDFKPDILTELTDVPELHSVKLSVIFFHRSNWQNEGLRIARRNKFMCALMVNLQLLKIESPNNLWPGTTQTAPMYVHHFNNGAMGPPPNYATSPPSLAGSPPGSAGSGSGQLHRADTHDSAGNRMTPIPEEQPVSLKDQRKRVDFSLGARRLVASDDMTDIHTLDDGRSVPQVAYEQAEAERQEREQGLIRQTSRQSQNSAQNSRASFDSHQTPGSRLARHFTGRHRSASINSMQRRVVSPRGYREGHGNNGGHVFDRNIDEPLPEEEEAVELAEINVVRNDIANAELEPRRPEPARLDISDNMSAYRPRRLETH
ncbi:hypothetical protein YB2330_002136 [Saitoella coloradoensis]